MFAYCENSYVSNVDPFGTYNIKKFNCYSYAMGITNRWLMPNNQQMPYYYTVDKVKSWVLKDFGNKIRVISSKSSKLNKGEYRIALRVSYAKATFSGKAVSVTLDFHFWKQNPKTGEWWNKHGAQKIQYLGNVNPNNTASKGWMLSGGLFPFIYKKKTYYCRFYGPLCYNSPTIYFAYKGKFWSK